MRIAFTGTIFHMTAAELDRLAEELGLDVVGAAPASAYVETERHIRERKARGLFADMRFTMARPEVSCHPEALVPGARTVVSAAHCYYAPEPPLQSGEGRLPRYTWYDAYAVLRERLEELGRRIGGEHRVLVDQNQHVDREAAARSGVGFYGKNTLLITRRHGSWVVLGTLVTTAEIEATPPLDADCGTCTLCIDACPTDALDEPGVLDSTKCLSYWTQSASAIPDDYRPPLGAQVYGCDICQDVCPWNRGVEKRRADAELPADSEPHVSLADWLCEDDGELTERYDRLYVPRNEARFLRRNALVALANTGRPEDLALAKPFLTSDDELLREQAEWTVERIGVRARAPGRLGADA
jgi:epoxyqueuosine reductase